MRICHFADNHLGAGENHPRRGESGLTLRQEDIVNGFAEAIDQIIALKPDLCLNAGDLFHTVRPTNRIMAIAGEHLHRLAAVAGIPTIIISGNHDAPKQPHIGCALEVFRNIPNLYIACESKVERFQIGDACVTALPHCLTTDILKDQLAQCQPSSQAKYNLLMMHGVAAGMPEFSMVDLGEQELPLDLMDQFDYVALGHFHNFCKVAARAWYSGSTERLSQSERDSAKGFTLVELDPLKVMFQETRSRPMIDLPAIDATGKRGDQVAEAIRAQLEQVGSSDKIVRVNIIGVTEETIKTMPVGVISTLRQDSYALDIKYQKKETDEITPEFGRSSIGRLDVGFVDFLETVDLKGYDKERLKKMATRYLAEGT